MEIAFGCGLAGILLLLIGIWHLLTPVDDHWDMQEKWLRRQGSVTQRTAEWESGIKSSRFLLVGIGASLLLFSVAAHVFQPKMSNFTINGRRLTQAEADACGNNIDVCFEKEQRSRRGKFGNR
ncbi:MAG TPA: hypothetical protein VF627_11755 [Abditibacterium sp.]|jgi:hypothetical protein